MTTVIRYANTHKTKGLIKPREGDAGYDLYAPWDFIIKPNDHYLMHTGIHIELPENTIGWITDRSSMARKDITVIGGIVDSSYRGSISVILANLHPRETAKIKQGDRVAQMIIVPVLTPDTEEVELEELSETERGMRGFGSTGR